MKTFKIVAAIALIALLIFALVIFLNPFFWGMGHVKLFQFPQKFTEIETIIKKDSVFGGYFHIESPTEKYMKNCERGYINNKKSLNVSLGKVISEKHLLDSNSLYSYIDNYAEIILKTLPQKSCFDGLEFRFYYEIKDPYFPRSEVRQFRTRKYPIKN